MKQFLTFFLFISLSLQFCLASYTGRCFIDKNGSGKFDKGDIPCANIVVTDGQNVVKTASDGTFTLPGYERTHFITITTPAGYGTTNYYIPVDASLSSYDFILYKTPKTASKKHSFIQITDTEIHNGITGNWVDYLKSYIAAEQPAFLVHTGDICYETGLKNHIRYVNTNSMKCPVYYGIGNHDYVKGDYGEQLFEWIYGPIWYSFDVGNIHYVMTPMLWGDYKTGFSKEEVYRWLKNDLAMMSPDQSLIIFNHDILTTADTFYFGTDGNNRIDLRKYNLKAWIYGHWHYNYVRNQNGVYTVCTSPVDKGGIDHSPSNFRVFQINNKDIQSMNLHYYGTNHNMVVVSPTAHDNHAILTPEGKIVLSVNLYHTGSEVKQVRYRLKSEGSQKYESFKPLHKQTDWNWYAEIPVLPAYKGKKIDIEIRGEFSDGHTHSIYRNVKCDSVNLISTQTDENWTNLLKNVQHTGETFNSLHLPLQLKWVKNVGSNIFMASPLIVDNRVFVASIDDNNAQKAAVYALDIYTGKILWKYTTRNSVKNSIAYDNGKVFAQDAEGYLYAIDAQTGKLVREKQLPIGYFPYITEGLIAGNGIVYSGTGKCLTALGGLDGETLWTNTDWDKAEGATTTLTLGNNVLTAGTQWGALYGNDARTGKMLWKLNQDGLGERGASTVFHNDKFYVTSKKSIFIIEPQTGEIIKKRELKDFNLNVTSSPLITDDAIIFGTADKGLVALDKESFNLKWNIPTGTSMVFTSPYTHEPFASIETSPVYSNGIVYFGASNGFLYGVDAETGKIVWSYEAGAPVFASMAISGNVLIAVDFSGNVYKFAGIIN